MRLYLSFLFAVFAFALPQLVSAQPAAKDSKAEQVRPADGDEATPEDEADRDKYTKLLQMKDQSSSDWFKKEWSANIGVGLSSLLANPPGESFGSKSSSLLLHLGVENYFTHDFAFGGFVEYAGYSHYFDPHVSIVTLGINPRYIMGGIFYIGAKGGVRFVSQGSDFDARLGLGPNIGFDFPINSKFTVGIDSNVLFFTDIDSVSFAELQLMAVLRNNF